MVWLSIFGVVLSLSVYFPTELGEKADPFQATPTGIRPEWYFLSMFQFLKYFPSHLGPFEGERVAIGLIGVFSFILVLIPSLDVWSNQGKRFTPFKIIGILGLIFVIWTTIQGYYGF